MTDTQLAQVDRIKKTYSTIERVIFLTGVGAMFATGYGGFNWISSTYKTTNPQSTHEVVLAYQRARAYESFLATQEKLLTLTNPAPELSVSEYAKKHFSNCLEEQSLLVKEIQGNTQRLAAFIQDPSVAAYTAFENDRVSHRNTISWATIGVSGSIGGLTQLALKCMRKRKNSKIEEILARI